MNHGLRQAMSAAKLTEQQLAEACDVDAKTVARWISNSARVPHAKHRWRVCELLGASESELWPSSVRLQVKSGPDREVVQVYPYRSAAPASLWRSLISNARTELTFAGYTNYFLRREQPDGMFDRFTEHVEELWSRGRDVWEG